MTQIQTSTHLARTFLVITLLSLPVAASAYLDPYDVLFPNELSLPADGRNSQARVERQQMESAARRDREQAAIIAEQRPPPEEEEFIASEDEEQFFASAPDIAGLEDDGLIDRETLTMLRTLQRVRDDQNRAKATQQAISLLQQEGLHSGAPLLNVGGNRFLPTGSKGPLYPTGMGSMIAALVLLCATFWTIRRAGQSEQFTNKTPTS